MKAGDKGKMVQHLQNYAYTYNTGINQFNIPTVTPTTVKKAQAPNSQKLQKALAVGKW